MALPSVPSMGQVHDFITQCIISMVLVFGGLRALVHELKVLRVDTRELRQSEDLNGRHHREFVSRARHLPNSNLRALDNRNRRPGIQCRTKNYQQRPSRGIGNPAEARNFRRTSRA